MSANAAVVIPVYKEELDEFEKISLAQVKKILGNYPLIFVAPEGKNFSYAAGSQTVYFPQKFFVSVNSYNQLMKSPSFYEKFLSYEYILIYQLDAFVFSDMMNYFCSLGYDFIGASWIYHNSRKIVKDGKIYHPRVGNGGFSLRKVSAFHNLLINHKNFDEDLQKSYEDEFYAEDVFFACCGILFDEEFHVAPLKISYQFAFEHLPKHHMNKNGGKLPFGCHSWYKAGADFCTEILAKFGYDLTLIRDKLPNDSAWAIRNRMMNLAYRRLIRRMMNGQSIFRYLPARRYASIRVIQCPTSMAIFTHLINEDKKISEKIFVYDANQHDTNILVQDLQQEELPHLIIASGIDESDLTEKIISRDITYGNGIVSFHREYMNYCEKLFHNLGK